jgi:hypothetical protein
MAGGDDGGRWEVIHQFAGEQRWLEIREWVLVVGVIGKRIREIGRIRRKLKLGWKIGKVWERKIVDWVERVGEWVRGIVGHGHLRLGEVKGRRLELIASTRAHHSRREQPGEQGENSHPTFHGSPPIGK